MLGYAYEIIDDAAVNAIDAGALADTLDGTGGDDTLSGSAGADSLSGQSGMDRLWGEAGDDTLDGGAGVDYLYGGNGNDVLRGGADMGLFIGGTGNDTMFGGDAGDFFFQYDFAGNDTIDGGDGVDFVDYNTNSSAASSVRVDLASGSVLKFNKDALVGRDSLRNIEKVDGCGGNDTLIGNAGNDVMHGLAGNDNLFGDAGNDALFGGDGNDLFIQSDWEGHDTFSGEAGKDTLLIHANLINGAALELDVAASTVTKLRNGVVLGTDVLSSIETVKVFGAKGANILRGGAMQVSFDASTGTGRASYASDNASVARINGNLDSGTMIKYGKTGAEIGRDTLRNFDKLEGTSNNDTLTGSRLADALIGAGGNDILKGGDGNDTLTGGLGNDQVSGGNGDDLLVQDAARGSDTLDGGAGLDTVDYRGLTDPALRIMLDLGQGMALTLQGAMPVASQTLRNIESVRGTHQADMITGSTKADLLSGEGGNDTLNGGAGNDSLSGGAGDDSLLQREFLNGSEDSFDGGDGQDSVDYSQIKVAGFRLTAHLDPNFGIVAKTLNGASRGIDYLTNIERFVGSAYDDAIFCGRGDDNIDAGSGNDRIDGGDCRGNGSIDGGTGSDTLDYSQPISAGASVSVDVAARTVMKYLEGQLVGTDYFQNIEQIIDHLGRVTQIDAVSDAAATHEPDSNEAVAELATTVGVPVA